MIRKIIFIDEEKCDGCGICADACHEGAIEMIDGKAKLMREDYCDGLGDCLPACPAGAISFVEREAAEYDEAAVLENKRIKEKERSEMKSENASEGRFKAGAHEGGAGGTGCPGSQPRELRGGGENVDDETEKTGRNIRARLETLSGGCPGSRAKAIERTAAADSSNSGDTTAGYVGAMNRPVSQLRQWPCQIRLVPENAPYFDGARLLIAADCAAYAYAALHDEFMRGRITLIGCPKLDPVDYSEKLTRIIAGNDIREVTVVRMQVPCCGGLENAVVTALKASGKFIPWQVRIISTDGRILD